MPLTSTTAGSRPKKTFALRGEVKKDDLRAFAVDLEHLTTVIEESEHLLVCQLSLGRFHVRLPDEVRSQVALDVLDLDGFSEWLATRMVIETIKGDEIDTRLDRACSDLF